MTALHAEWTKLRTVSGPAWLLLAAALCTTALSTAAVTMFHCPAAGCGVDLTRLSLTGVQLGQAVVAVVAVLAVGNEYSTGMIHTTLTAVPRRIWVLAAKALVVTAVVLVAAASGVLGSILVGQSVLPISLAHGPTLRAAGGSVLYLALIALLSLGVAALVRESAAAIGLVLGLLYVLPIFISVVSDPAWQRHLRQATPSTAGLAIEATTGLADLPIGPWAGLGVLGAWAAGALVAGGLSLVVRDA